MPRTKPADAPPHVWHRIAEEVQSDYPQDLELTPHRIEHHFTGEETLPHPQEIVDTIVRTARTYGIEVDA